MTLYDELQRVRKRTQLDRNTWAGPNLLIISYDTIGSGTFETEPLEFGLVFDEVPFFSYGVEVQPGQDLIPGDYPIVNCGVKEWTTTVPEFEQSSPFYTGATVWIHVSTNSTYRMRFRLSFEGTAIRNVEYFRQ